MNKIIIEKGKTIGIFGQKGTGKTYFTRQIIEVIPKNVIVFDTIGALHPSNVKIYNVEPRNFDKQVILFSQISRKTNRNVGLDFKMLTKKEIVEFTNKYLLITNIKNKYIAIDEMADYTPQIGESSQELERLIRHGRNEGDTFIFNTQRPAYITKDILNLVDVAVFFRLVWDRDLIVVKDLLNGLGKKQIPAQVNEITNLRVGKCKIYKF
jgi:DNA helicase HerA-like ATPase